MIITETSTTSREREKSSHADLINMEKFNALPGLVIARLFSGDEWCIESLCVQSSVMRLDVCGQIDISAFSLVAVLIDGDGNEHNPDDFWIED